eukprot:gb/GFBE01012616.1/.p1 GENE.gb/GFBE01012616.1/~~gb/GFBE01012616.1/.p1  ORF type:complete len:261 (+),score=65.19 gb/GFBE01012616.1/:1-783(+)
MAAATLGLNRYAALMSDDEEEGEAKNADRASGSAEKKAPKKKAKKKRQASEAAVIVKEPEVVDKKKRKRSDSMQSGEGKSKESNAAKTGESDGKPSSASAAVDSSSPEGTLPLAAGVEKTIQGGVSIKVIRAAPAGAKVATKGCEVKLLYEGRLPGKNGRRFDVGEIDFLLGDGTMLQGFAIGVMGMAVGERRLIRIPWRLGYGRKGKKPKIPPMSDLEFDATLNFCGVDWEKRVSNKTDNMSNKRREAAKRRGKKPKAT